MTADVTLVAALAALIGLAASAVAWLKGWRAWLQLKREEMTFSGYRSPSGELSEIRRRVRQLETIASGSE